MATLARFRQRLEDLVLGESGMALPTALFATIASMGLASAAVISSVDVQQGTRRDSSSKSAIAAADAGANVALLRLNRYATALSSSTPCLGVSAGTLVVTTAAGDGWCPEVTGTVGGSSYAYRTTPQVSGSTMSVVSTGTAGTVSRRIAVTYKTTTIGSVLSAEGLIGQDGITLSNSVEIHVGVGTNGDVSLTNSATICGNIREGVGKGPPSYKNSAKQCSGYGATEGNVTVPAVSTFIPTDIATNNSNYRLVKCTATNVPSGCGSDTYTSNQKSSWPWDPLTREISLSNSSSLTLGGGDYFICRLSLSNSSHLIMASGAHVRIFIDAPENCPGVSTTQVDVSNSSDITATGYKPEIGQFDMPGIYVMGSTSKSTSISFGNSSAANEFVLYAPNSTISWSNSATFKGPIVGKSISLSNSVKIERDSGYEPPAIGGTTIYQRQSYVECTGATASPPNAYC